jgi:hypothetical protein
MLPMRQPHRVATLVTGYIPIRSSREERNVVLIAANRSHGILAPGHPGEACRNVYVSLINYVSLIRTGVRRSRRPLNNQIGRIVLVEQLAPDV